MLLTVVSFLNIISTSGQNPAPAKPQDKPVIIENGTLHTGTGKVIEKATIVFQKGKIIQAGESTVISLSADEMRNAITIDASGKQVYPGLIALNTNLGLSEIELVRATNDFSETGTTNASARSCISYNTDSKVIPTVRSNGVLMAQVTPQSGLISGNSSVMQLDAWNWEDALYKSDEGIHINWPSMRIFKAWWASPEEEQRERMQKNLNTLYSFFKEAKSYCESNSKDETNLQFESMRGIFNGTKKLYIHCDYVREINAAVNFCNDQKIKMVLVGGNDSWMTTDILKQNNIPVIITRTQSLPSRDDEQVYTPYMLPGLLQKAGVVYAISEGGFWQQRNLAFEAGQAVSYGISKEDALKSITLTPAQILEIDETTGSIETGKDASLIISDGDILDMKTNHITYAFIQGRQINLDDVQKQLYRKYCDKYGLKQ